MTIDPVCIDWMQSRTLIRYCLLYQNGGNSAYWAERDRMNCSLEVFINARRNDCCNWSCYLCSYTRSMNNLVSAAFKPLWEDIPFVFYSGAWTETSQKCGSSSLINHNSLSTILTSLNLVSYESLIILVNSHTSLAVIIPYMELQRRYIRERLKVKCYNLNRSCGKLRVLIHVCSFDSIY